jgi:hypothetical protein
MSFAFFDVVEVCQACNGTAAAEDKQLDASELARLQHLSDLVNRVLEIQGAEATVAISAEDFALIKGHWPPVPAPQDAIN